MGVVFFLPVTLGFRNGICFLKMRHEGPFICWVELLGMYSSFWKLEKQVKAVLFMTVSSVEKVTFAAADCELTSTESHEDKAIFDDGGI